MMPCDKHLTPRGWETGARPADAVETARIFEAYPNGTVRFETVWVNGAVDPAERERLYRLYLPIPN